MVLLIHGCCKYTKGQVKFTYKHKNVLFNLIEKPHDTQARKKTDDEFKP